MLRAMMICWICDVRLFRIYEGTTQIQQIVIARNMIKAAQK